MDLEVQEDNMLQDYDSLGCEITCKKLPRGCFECPFEEWVGEEGEEFMCLIIGPQDSLKADGQQEHRMKNCPLKGPAHLKLVNRHIGGYREIKIGADKVTDNGNIPWNMFPIDIFVDDNYEEEMPYCSKCGRRNEEETPYCPYCGAPMGKQK